MLQYCAMIRLWEFSLVEEMHHTGSSLEEMGNDKYPSAISTVFWISARIHCRATVTSVVEVDGRQNQQSSCPKTRPVGQPLLTRNTALENSTQTLTHSGQTATVAAFHMILRLKFPISLLILPTSYKVILFTSTNIKVLMMTQGRKFSFYFSKRNDFVVGGKDKE